MNLRLPDSILEVLSFFESKGIQLCLVGGCVRDFIRTSRLSTDLDFEVVADHLDAFHSAVREFEKLFNIEVKRSEYEVCSFRFNEFSIEFAPARIEIFESSLGHKNFNCQYLTEVNHHLSFARRDFTINSIGYIYRNGEFALSDPFDGINDLKNNLLKTKNPNFYLDPVRFFRLLRFCILYKLKIDPDLEVDLHKFNLEKTSLHYFKYEGFKCGLIKFSGQIFDIVSCYNINIDQKLLNCCKSITKLHAESDVFSVDDLLKNLVRSELDQEKLESIVSYFNFKKKVFNDIVFLQSRNSKISSDLYCVDETELFEIYKKYLKIDKSLIDILEDTQYSEYCYIQKIDTVNINSNDIEKFLLENNLDNSSYSFIKFKLKFEVIKND